MGHDNHAAALPFQEAFHSDPAAAALDTICCLLGPGGADLPAMLSSWLADSLQKAAESDRHCRLYHVYSSVHIGCMALEACATLAHGHELPADLHLYPSFSRLLHCTILLCCAGA